jgi:hypothetical protein
MGESARPLDVPTLLLGSPWAGPYAYSRFASSCSTNIDNRTPSPALVYSSIYLSPIELPKSARGRRPIIRWMLSGLPALLSLISSFGSLVRSGLPFLP